MTIGHADLGDLGLPFPIPDLVPHVSRTEVLGGAVAWATTNRRLLNFQPLCRCLPSLSVSCWFFPPGPRGLSYFCHSQADVLRLGAEN